VRSAWWCLTPICLRIRSSMLVKRYESFTRINKESSFTVLRRGNAHHRAKHSVTSLPRQRCRRPTPRFCAAGTNGTNMCQCWSARRSATAIDSNPPKRLTYHCTDRVRNILSAPLYIFRIALLLLQQCRGAGLGELQRARGRSKYYRTRPHPACFARRPRPVR
jgi:hypothetical protein